MLAYIPRLLWKRKYHRGLWQRVGFYPQAIRRQLWAVSSSVWLHAVSVGEVAAIRPFWEALRREFPSRKIIVSTVTRTGNELAKKFAAEGDIVLYVPLDFSFTIDAAIRRFKPAALVIAETEIWPNLITRCKNSRIPVMLVNGRISGRAFDRYRRFKFLLRGVLAGIDIFCVRTEEDRDRFVSLGAPKDKITVAGNLKFCAGLKRQDPARTDRFKKELGLKAGGPVLAAGSTHEPEEKMVLAVYKNLLRDFPGLGLILAPRHIERAPRIRALAEGLAAVRVIDRIGVLKDVYGISDIVFVGGSLVRHGGQNIIEPAALAKPVLFGPHMFNFRDEAREFLENGGAIMVRDAAELESASRRLLGDEAQRVALGARAREIVMKNQGALEKCLDASKRVLAHA